MTDKDGTLYVQVTFLRGLEVPRQLPGMAAVLKSWDRLWALARSGRHDNLQQATGNYFEAVQREGFTTPTHVVKACDNHK